MGRFFIEISYDGTLYSGWQVQPNGMTVQQRLDEAISKAIGENVDTVGCGRTDAGVHAKQFFAHFDTEQTLSDLQRLEHQLNGILPSDISVHGIRGVDDELHARFSATERAYEYQIHSRKDPFLERYSMFVPHALDIELMNNAGRILLATSDFASFCKAGSDVKTTLCDVRNAEWVEDGHKLVLHISADRFLRNMVRAIVGTMIDVGKKKIDLEEFSKIVESGDRGQAGVSAKAQGLFLTRVEYP